MSNETNIRGTIKNVDFINPCDALQKKGIVFDNSRDMQQLWVKSGEAFMSSIGASFGRSCVASMKNNKLTILEMDEPVCTETEYNGKSAMEKWKWEREAKKYDAFETKTIENLSKCREMLWNSCTLSLKSRISADYDYEDTCDAGELWHIIKKICNGSGKTAAENVLTNLVDAIFNWFYLIANDFTTLTQFIESFQILRTVAVECGFDIATENLRDKWMNELDNRDANNTKVYKTLNAWKLADLKSADGIRDEEAGRECLSEAFATQVFIKRSGKKHAMFRADQENAYNNGAINAAVTILEASRRMELYRPVIMGSNESNVIGTTFQQSGDLSAIECFKCGRIGHRANRCTFQTKEDGSPVNSTEEVNRMFDRINERTQEQKSKQEAEKLKQEQADGEAQKEKEEEKI